MTMYNYSVYDTTIKIKSKTSTEVCRLYLRTAQCNIVNCFQFLSSAQQATRKFNASK